MNTIITTHVSYHGKKIAVENLKPNSQLAVIVECEHGQRQIRWSRRMQPCKQCAVKAGVYHTSLKGRVITWGNKISKAKRGIPLTKEHKKSLVKERKEKFCKRVGISHEEFIDFPSYNTGRWNISVFLRQAIITDWDITKVEIDETAKEIFTILGWSLLDLKKHLEGLFTSDMSWSNYGYEGWHVDHVKPLSWFNIVSIQDKSFKDCWSLSNLQPLWKIDNFKKNNHYVG
jgi:hypothetical protein